VRGSTFAQQDPLYLYSVFVGERSPSLFSSLKVQEAPLALNFLPIVKFRIFFPVKEGFLFFGLKFSDLPFFLWLGPEPPPQKTKRPRPFFTFSFLPAIPPFFYCGFGNKQPLLGRVPPPRTPFGPGCKKNLFNRISKNFWIYIWTGPSPNPNFLALHNLPETFRTPFPNNLKLFPFPLVRKLSLLTNLQIHGVSEGMLDSFRFRVRQISLQ